MNLKRILWPSRGAEAKKYLRIMKLAWFLILFLTLQTNASLWSQTIQMDVHLQNTTLLELFTHIEKNSEYRFFYSNDEVDVNQRVTVTAKNKVIGDILNEAFKDLPYFFKELNGKMILVEVKSAETNQLDSKQSIVSGKVTDDNGEPLPGATVIVKGTTQGTVTNFEGDYTLQNVAEGAVLQFSFVGMRTQEVVFGKQTIVNITLEADAIGIDEVVAIGYGVQKKSNLTGAISKVESSAMENRSITQPEQALQGKTAGVQIINTSGAPGATPAVRVRGFSSNSASPPLYIVDGLRTDDIGLIDPENIESMEILKDAASAAIYGAEAGNGVILITTKKGKKGEGTISYNYQMVTNKLASFPDLMNAEEYINYMTEGDLISADEINSLWDGTTDTDWADATFETSLMMKHNLAFEGGNDRGVYNLSLSYLNYDGIVKGKKDYLERITGMLNADYKIKDWLKIGTNNIFEHWKGRSVSENSEYGSLLGAVLAMDPLTPVTYSPDNLPEHMQNLLAAGKTLLTDEDGNYYGLSQFFESEQIHPLITRDRIDAESQGMSLAGTIYAELTPLKNFTFTSKLGYRVGYTGSYSFSKIYYANTVSLSDNISVSRTNSNNVYYQWENYANYLKTFGDHTVSGMAGISYSAPYSTYVTGTGNELTKDDPAFRDLDYLAATATKAVAGGYSEEGRQYSYFGRVSYDYKEKYLIQASLRRDASDLSVLPAENRWGTFPAVSVGYVVSKEDFFPQNTPITHLKVRGSWGQNGSIGPLSDYCYSATISSSESYPYYSDFSYQVASYPSVLENPELQWETSEQLDLGIDLLAFDSRMAFTFDYFNKKTRDLLVAVTPPYETGVSSVTVNAGNVLNRGFEFEMSWRDKIGDLSYSINANLSTLHNEVTYLDPSISRIDGASFHTNSGITAFEEGFPIWYMRGYELEGINDATGDPVYVDQLTVDTNDDGIMDEADGSITEDDKVMIGSAIPDFTYGLTFSANYKGFDLTVFGSGSQGNDIFLAMTRNDRPRSNQLKVFYDDRWTETNTTASKPRPNSNGVDKYYISDDVIFDGSYFRIKQIQLGYNLPKNLVRKMYMKNLRVYVSLDDWFTFTDYPGFDPEASAGSTSALGVDKGSYPISRKTTLGVNITF